MAAEKFWFPSSNDYSPNFNCIYFWTISVFLRFSGENNSSYRVNIVDNDIIEIMSIEQNTLVSFLFFKNRLELIRYTDSIGVEHGIELRPL